MTLLERRRQMMSRKAEPEWDYVLTEKYGDGTDRLKPMLVPVIAGQTIVIAWGGCTSFGYIPRLWTLKNGGKFVGITRTDMITKDIKTVNGKLTYTVETSGDLVLAGFNYQTGAVAVYLYHGDFVKARIT